MIQPHLGAALGDGEVNARVVQHPFGVIRFGDGRFGGEHGRVKADARREVVDSDVDMQAFHEALLLAVGLADARTGTQDFPPQQFSVRKATKAFIASKFAA